VLAALGLMWLPHLLPFVFGPLTECGHCVRTYLQYFAVMPGFPAGPLSGVPESLIWVPMVAATAAIFLLLTLGWRAFGRHGRLLLAALCVAGFAANGLMIASLLRA